MAVPDASVVAAVAVTPADRATPPARGASARPRVLVIATDIPWPLDSGYRIRAHENLRALTVFADVSVVCFSEDPDPIGRLLEASASLPEVSFREPVPLRIHIKDEPMLLARAVGTGLLSGRPYKIAKFASAEMQRRVRHLVSVERFDALHVELATLMFAEAANADGAGRRLPVVLDEYNVEWQLLRDHARGARGPLAPAIALEARRTRSYEAAACRRADLVVAISEEDAADFVDMADGRSTVRVVPPVAPQPREPAVPPDDPHRQTVLFVGQLSWLPNAEAVRWFCDGVLPVLKRDHPDLRFVVVGGGAPDELERSIRETGGSPLGYVSDLAGVYREAAVFVAPFLTAGGVRIKLLEAMSERVPIVATSAGARGLAVQVGRELLVSDAPEDFAAAVGGLLEDRILRREVTNAAIDYLENNHSRRLAAECMGSAYASIGLTRPRAAHSGTVRKQIQVAVGRS